MLKNVNNPQAMLSQMMQNNPNFKQIESKVNDIAKQYGGDYEKATKETLKQMGIDPSDFMK